MCVCGSVELGGENTVRRERRKEERKREVGQFSQGDKETREDKSLSIQCEWA